MVVGIYGMNFKFMPELDSRSGIPNGDDTNIYSVFVYLCKIQKIRLAMIAVRNCNADGPLKSSKLKALGVP